MVRDQRDTYESYQKDAFDNPPAGPMGVHRGNTSWWTRLVPYLVVLIVAALAGLLVWGFYSQELQKVFVGKDQNTSQTETASKKKKDSGEKKNDSQKEESKKDNTKKDDTKTDDSATEQQPAPQPAQQVNKQTAVRIVNATRINGYGAKKQAVLQQAGYSSVTAANPSGQLPKASVVWYQNESDKATAQDVANALGITAVEQQNGTAQPIVVVLLN
jgi:FtsZ-interacting cell division protein ZipA